MTQVEERLTLALSGFLQVASTTRGALSDVTSCRTISSPSPRLHPVINTLSANILVRFVLLSSVSLLISAVCRSSLITVVSPVLERLSSSFYDSCEQSPPSASLSDTTTFTTTHSQRVTDCLREEVRGDSKPTRHACLCNRDKILQTQPDILST